MLINWVQCNSYDDAKDYSRVIYLHEWDGKPFYWGKADNSFFGGHKRKYDGLHASGRYNSGYRHWIEGCLRHGAKLYIGRLDELARTRIDDIENYMIVTFGHVMNTKVRAIPGDLDLPRFGGRVVESIYSGVLMLLLRLALGFSVPDSVSLGTSNAICRVSGRSFAVC